MRKILALLATLALILMGAVLLSGTASAATQKTDGECVPQDAWTETIEHPEVSHVVHHDAVTHTVHHEAVTHVVHHEAVTHTVHHEAVTEIVKHDAVTHMEYHFAKFTQTREGIKKGNTITWGAYGPWTKWSPETHTSWELNTDPIGTPQLHGSGHDGNKYWERVWQAQYDGQSRVIEDEPAWEETVVVTPAYDETVVDEEAYDETVVDQEAYDEIVVDTEAYDETVIDEEAWTETIEHPAVVCIPDRPDVVKSQESTSSYKCGDNFETVVTTTTTQGWVYNELTNEWDPGKPIITTETSKNAVDVVKCEVTPPVKHNKPPKKHEIVTVNSGTLPNTGGPNGILGALGAGLLLGGTAVIINARRKNSSERV